MIQRDENKQMIRNILVTLMNVLLSANDLRSSVNIFMSNIINFVLTWPFIQGFQFHLFEIFFSYSHCSNKLSWTLKESKNYVMSSLTSGTDVSLININS